MPLTADKSTVTAVIPLEMKEKLRSIAKLRRWSLSQAVGALIEDSFEEWVAGLGITLEPAKPKTQRKRKSTP